MLNDEQLLQYSRHLMLPQIDAAGQAKWLNASVLVVGLGGLGSPVALYLATAGVGSLVLADDDQVELSNLQRQVIHNHAGIGQNKAVSAAQQIASLNPHTHVSTLCSRLEGDVLIDEVNKVDLVVDCTDNFVTRHALNQACFESSTPLVSGAAIRFEGQVTVYDPRHESTPCYQCLYPVDASVEQNCSTSGVFSPLVGMVGTIQAAEALKVLANIGETLEGRMLMIDALTMQFQTLKLPRRKNCEVCGGDQ